MLFEKVSTPLGVFQLYKYILVIYPACDISGNKLYCCDMSGFISYY